MLCMLCDGWVLTGAYAGNLTVTLIASSGALFLAFAWALTSQGTRADFIKGGLALLLASFLALYSYAAVRIPWTMSLAVIYCVVAARVALKGGGLARAALSVSALMLPLLALAVVILAVGYGGNTQGLLGDLLVSWPSASVLKHPVAEELSKYVLIHNPDVPIWKQVARPTNGDNFSYIWTRTPGEILAAFLAHTSLILGDRPQYFFLQAPSLLLIVLALVRFPLNDAKVRTATLALLLWAVLWVSSYLLVPDAVAYRRGIAFSAISAALASLAVISASDAKRYKQWLMLGLTVLYCFYSLPQQLVFSNDPETRSRMFTVCSSSFAVRALLSDPQISALSDVPLTVSLAGLENVREAGCVAHATTTSEWKRLLPQAQVDPGRSFENLFELLPAGGPDSVLVYCSPSAHRLPRLAKVCLGEEAGLDTVKTVPVVYGGVFDKWVAFSRK
jgi:hypothetical protein